MLLYNILLYLILILFSPVFLIMYIFIFYQIRERFALADPDVIDSRKSILIHGASLGEMGIIKKILPEIVNKFPDHPIIVSSTTISGKKNIISTMQNIISHAICFPLEFRFSVRRLLKITNPSVVVITETELWPNFICEAKRFGARVVLINGRISDKSFSKYFTFKKFFRKTLNSFDAIGCQNKEYFERFIKIGAAKSILFITGNIKTSLRTENITSTYRENLRRTLGIKADRKIIIAASTRPGEEEMVIRSFLKAKKEIPNLYLILAPRHLNRINEVEALIFSMQISFIKKTNIITVTGIEDIMLLDTHGELASLYGIAEAAFIGGTLADFGGHNLLEPLPFEVPVSFGPFFGSQKESANFILSNECGALVNDTDELSAFILRIITDETYTAKLKSNIKKILNNPDSSIKANLNLI